MTHDEKIIDCTDSLKDTYMHALKLSRIMRETLEKLRDSLHRIYGLRFDDDTVDDLPFKS